MALIVNRSKRSKQWRPKTSQSRRVEDFQSALNLGVEAYHLISAAGARGIRTCELADRLQARPSQVKLALKYFKRRGFVVPSGGFENTIWRSHNALESPDSSGSTGRNTSEV